MYLQQSHSDYHLSLLIFLKQLQDYGCLLPSSEYHLSTRVGAQPDGGASGLWASPFWGRARGRCSMWGEAGMWAYSLSPRMSLWFPPKRDDKKVHLFVEVLDKNEKKKKNQTCSNVVFGYLFPDPTNPLLRLGHILRSLLCCSLVLPTQHESNH